MSARCFLAGPFVLFLTIGIAGEAKAVATDGAVVIREITTRAPNEVSLFYRFSGPLRSLRLDLTYKEGAKVLETLEIKLGNGISLSVPPSVLQCFPNPQGQDAFVLFQEPDKHYPRLNDHWWMSVALPYGRPSGPSESQTEAGFPYVEFQFMNWKLSRIQIQRSSHEARAILFPSDACPAIDIDWSLKGGSDSSR
jgi:hypothetical protein